MKEELKKFIAENGAEKAHAVFAEALKELNVKVMIGISFNGLRKQLSRNYNQLITDIEFFVENLSDMYTSDKQNFEEVKNTLKEISILVASLNSCYSNIYDSFEFVEFRLREININREEE